MSTFQELVETLKDPGKASYRRQDAAASLAKLEDKRAVKPLVEALSDADRYVCRAAIQALGVLGDTRAVRPLKEFLTHSDSELRRRATTALGETGDPTAVGAVTAMLEDSSFVVRNAAKKALEKLQAHTSEAKKTPVARAGKGKVVVDTSALMKEALAGAGIKATRRGHRYSLSQTTHPPDPALAPPH